MEGERVRGETGGFGERSGGGRGSEGGREGGKGETERWRERVEGEREKEKFDLLMEVDSSMKFAYLLCTSGYTCVSSNLTMVIMDDQLLSLSLV